MHFFKKLMKLKTLIAANIKSIIIILLNVINLSLLNMNFDFFFIFTFTISEFFQNQN